MAKKHHVRKIVFEIITRIALICATIFAAAYSGLISLNILENYLGYKTPDDFFGFTLADQFISLELGLVFWSGIFFGVFGKWWDFLFVFLFTILAVWDYQGTSTTTPLMYIGLAVAALLGNAIGFGLKLLRQKYFPKLDI